MIKPCFFLLFTLTALTWDVTLVLSATHTTSTLSPPSRNVVLRTDLNKHYNNFAGYGSEWIWANGTDV